MKEFYGQCLTDLYALTSINQVYWIMNRPNGEGEIRKMIEAMATVSDQYKYIPQEDQRRIILDRMVKEDSKYYRENGLSAWQVDKWLGMYSGHFKSVTEAEKPMERIIRTPEEDAKIDALLEDWKKQLASISNVPNYSKVKEEIKRIQKEDKLRIDGEVTVKDKVKSDKEYILLMERKDQAQRSRGLHLVGMEELNEYNVDGKFIWARNETEAQELYLEIYI